ncbi:hypothetical protein R0137_11215 [Congregibacter brevis]|uniref:Uncharacterized protein n=1 Tax=Congregibacter brevis TaxID=3081201 RepID=A0ABZ0I8G5_9GAMM|nr:hypothetical protein R0137_11215 [Congregibacter sp. IMCC45268]
MSNSARGLLAKALRTVASLMPWAAALYLHYYLEDAGVWQVDMPFRGAISVTLLGVGMLLSFVLYSVLGRIGR